MGVTFSTKAETLAALTGRLATARILPMAFFSVQMWRSQPGFCLEKIALSLGEGPYIVRSSCLSEDSTTASHAGAFLSCLDVSAPALGEHIEQVIASYGTAQDEDQILVQPMLQAVLCSGVAFSHDPNTGSPYRVINWSDGGDTTKITSGSGGHTWYHAAAAPHDVVAPAFQSVIQPVLRLLEELEETFQGQPLDCEFALTQPAPEHNDSAEPVLYLLQARPLIMTLPQQSRDQQATILRQIEQKVERGIQSHPFLMGKRTVYGIMPDWNPAEIIGIRPRPLALSLYRELVTDSIWAYQRHNYGYRNLRSFPLMPHFSGLPYIDVRLSFNSFIPANLDTGLAGRLVDYYIDRLLAEPSLHDKVEFEIVYSCYTLDLPKRLEALKEAGFSAAERQHIAECLRDLTNRIADPTTGLWRQDAQKLTKLAIRREQLYASDADLLERIYWLLEDGKRYGTLPFAGLARAGFIAVQMLRSLVSIGALSEADYDAFMASLSTVSGQLARDRALLTKPAFLARYGHLRPGTYDLMSPRYDEASEQYFNWENTPPPPPSPKPFSLTLQQMRLISAELNTHGLHWNAVDLFDFIQSGIELRESAKFEFSRNLSDILVLIERFGAEYGFSRDDLSYCNIAAFKELHGTATDPKKMLARAIENGREQHAQTLSVSLPPVIANGRDVWSFELPKALPNFISQKQVVAPVGKSDSIAEMAGKIICIPSADPGYDWVFSHPIAGLITAWGGMNSHMAIRAGELGLPSVIGAGQALYDLWSSAHTLHIDCASRQVSVLS